MAKSSEDFISGEDYDCILAWLSEDILNDDDDVSSEVTGIIQKAEENNSQGYQCDICSKLCKSKQGLSRHKNAKHKTENASSPESSSTVSKTPESLLHPLTYRKYVLESAKKLSTDECYSETTMKAFKDYTISIEENLICYGYVKDSIAKFKGDGEKFYPLFYKCVSDRANRYPRLSRRCSVLLGYEVANHVLSHLAGSKKCDEKQYQASELDSREKNVVTYLSGYVFSTLYRRLRTSRSRNDLSAQYMSLLSSGKCSEEAAVRDDETLVSAKNRGGLWRVKPEVV